MGHSINYYKLMNIILVILGICLILFNIVSSEAEAIAVGKSSVIGVNGFNFAYLPAMFIMVVISSLGFAFLKMTAEELLTNPMREEIYKYIEANPGVNFSTLMKKLDLKNGVLSYHLKTMEKADLIVSLKRKGQRVFYTRTYENIPEDIASKILYTIKKNPGIYQSELSKMLNVSRQVINYHITLLLKEDKIWFEQDGRKILLYARYKT